MVPADHGRIEMAGLPDYNIHEKEFIPFIR